MDKRSVLGFVLIGIVLMIWLYWNSSNQQKAVQNIKQKNDSININEQNKVNKNPVLTDSVSTNINLQELTDSLRNDSLVIKEKLFWGVVARQTVIRKIMFTIGQPNCCEIAVWC